jgi:predicted Zn-dependent protease with MMP-like domain
LTDEECRAAVRETLDSLPPDVIARLGDLAVVVEERHPDGLMGLYDPTGGIQRIVIFRSGNPTRDEVRKTVLHEVGHFLGLGQERLGDLGYG